ncbi:DUF2892 domain-containing protein [Microbacteriaceae bacterium 4G12]
MFKPNIGILSALIRITVGLTMISLSTAKLTRKPWSFTSRLSLLLGAMKVAEGIVRFCPTKEMMKFRKYMNLPTMDFLKIGQSNKQEAHSSYNGEQEYGASDEEIEAGVTAAVLGTKSY